MGLVGTVIVFSFSIVVGYAVLRILSFLRMWKRWCEVTRKLPHYDTCHWLWGDLDETTNTFQGILNKAEKFVQEGVKVYVTWMVFFRVVVTVIHPDTVKVVLRSSEPKAKAGGGYSFLVPWLGDGLLLSEGKKWERNRKLLTPAFHFDILQPYIKVYNSSADTLIGKLEQLSAGGSSVDVLPHISLATLDTVLQCALSYNDNVQTQGSMHPYVSAVQELTQGFLFRAMRPILYINFLYYRTQHGKKFMQACDFVHDFADKIIATRKKALEADPEILKRRHLDFLDILLAARDNSGQGLTDQEIRDEVDTFLFGGHDTTASAISWALYCLGKYQDEQDRVFRETEALISDGKDFDWDALSKMKRLTMFVKEAMRTHTTIPVISRELTRDIELDGVTIPKGSIVDVNFCQLHRHPKVWDNPTEFSPERFDPELGAGRNPYTFVPFSAGSRNCIGQNFAMNEIKVILAKILHKFHLDVDPERIPIPNAEVVRRSENGIHLKLTPRHI